MKGKNRIYFLTFALLSSLSFILYSCLDDAADLRNVKNIDEAARKKEISEARAFFENHAASIPIDAQPQGMYPGNFATDWDNATYVENIADSLISVNACIVPEYYYEGDFAKDYAKTPETDEDWYHTAISQKIVSLKDMRTSARCCYIITLIPDATCATQSRAEIDWLFNNGEGNGGFSGVAIYSTLENNTAMVADRFSKGKRVTRTSVFEGSNEIITLTGYINKYKPLRTKLGEDDYMYCFDCRNSSSSGSSSCSFCGSGVSYNSGSNTIYIDLGYSSTTNTNPSDRGSSIMSGGSSSSSSSGSYYPPSSSGGGGGGSSSPAPTPDPPKPPETPESVAPNATKIFNKSNSLTIAQWKKVEAMIVKMQKDCMGGELFNLLSAGTATVKINLSYSPNSMAPYTTSTSTTNISIVLNNLDDDCGLMHEMFHAYQRKGYSTQTAFENVWGNLEVEDKIATAMYAERDRRNLTSAEWNIKYSYREEDDFHQEAKAIALLLNSKGALNGTASTSIFNTMFYNLAREFRTQSSDFRIIETQTMDMNLKSLKLLSKKC